MLERMKESPSVKRQRRSRPGSYCNWPYEQRLFYYSTLDPLSGCRVWHGPKNRDGYARILFDGRQWLAHRLAWTLKQGPIPEGMILCHRCDERSCINPDHLFPGTRGDNLADLKAKRLARSDARADGGGTIRIIYRGVELVGEVRVAAVDPRVKAVEDSCGS